MRRPSLGSGPFRARLLIEWPYLLRVTDRMMSFQIGVIVKRPVGLSEVPSHCFHKPIAHFKAVADLLKHYKHDCRREIAGPYPAEPLRRLVLARVQ